VIAPGNGPLTSEHRSSTVGDMVSKPRTFYARGLARRTLVLEAAVDVIAEHGLEGVTHRAVAKAAGVPQSAPSYFFGSLDELIGAAVTQIADTILEAAQSLVADATTSGSRAPLDEYVDRLIDIVTAPRDRRILVQFEAYLGSTRRSELSQPVQRIVEAYEHAAETVLDSLGAAEPQRAGRELIALLDGFALQRIAHPRLDDYDVLRSAVRSLATWHLGVDPVNGSPRT
jgi:DNA-binding transcriptional regulator YbjK